MKIIICTKNLYSGAGVHVRTLLRKMEDSKEIKKICLIAPGHLDFRSQKIKSVSLGNLGKYFITKQILFSVRCKYIIRSVLKKEKYNIIHIHSPLLFKRFPIPVIATFHATHFGLRQISFDHKTLIANFFHYLYDVFDKITFKNAQKIIFVSNKTKKESEQRFPWLKNKDYYIPNGIDRDIFKPQESKKSIFRKKYGLNQKKKTILYVGRLDPIKGLSYLILAIQKIGISNIELAIVGSGPDINLIRNYKFIKYLGQVPHEKLSEIYNSADLFVLPSLYENFPISILEAMACGLPVIATDVGDIPCIISDRRFICQPRNSDDLKKKIKYLLNLNPQELYYIKTNNIAETTKYASEMIFNQIFKLYKSL